MLLRCAVGLYLLTTVVVAEAAPPADVAATNRVLKQVRRVLAEQGFTGINIGGGAALSLAMTARHGSGLAWNDVDIGGYPRRGKVDAARMKQVAAALTRGGKARVLAPGPFEFTYEREGGLRSRGFGMKLEDSTGAHYDIALLHGPAELKTAGFNSTEGLFIPLRKGDTVERIVARLSRGSAGHVVSRGDLIEPHGQAVAVLNNKIALTNKWQLDASPELVALRLLRGLEKLHELGNAKQKVDARSALRWIKKSLPRAMGSVREAKDPSYPFVVQDQAQKLLASGNRRLLTEAKKLGLDLRALAKGQLDRPAAR
jgi:hypothetical protein